MRRLWRSCARDRSSRVSVAQVLDLESKLRRHDDSLNTMQGQARQHTQALAAHEAENEKLRASLRAAEQETDRARMEVCLVFHRPVHVCV